MNRDYLILDKLMRLPNTEQTINARVDAQHQFNAMFDLGP